MLLVDQPGLEFHEETAGCILDYCYNRKDIVVGLRNMKFDHEECRSKIKNTELLKAIDILLALDMTR